MRWLLEFGPFGESHPFAEAVVALGHELIEWDDAWWRNGEMPEPGPAVFHGSLNNAAMISPMGRWSPGAFCDVTWLSVSNWTNMLNDVVLNPDVTLTTVRELCDSGAPFPLWRPEREIFVRPIGPLKEFSGRVLPASGITREMLDFGFYYEDPELPIVVALRRDVREECRFISLDGEIIAMSCYEPGHPRPGTPGIEMQDFVRSVASRVGSYAGRVIVIDTCDSDEGPRVVELGAFSGADPYGCDPYAIVDRISRAFELKGESHD